MYPICFRFISLYLSRSFAGRMIGVHGLCDVIYQRDAVLGFVDYHVDIDKAFAPQK